MARRRILPGDHPIEIHRDAHGVPHVRAASEADLMRGLGHCHAVDRGLAMLLVRIAGQGRASELLDSSAAMLAQDRFFRRLNPGADAEQEIAKLSEPHRALVEAYCDGINRVFARRVPWELRLLGYRPDPWIPADVILLSRVSGYVALAQSQGDMERVLVEMVQAGVPKPHLEALFPGGLERLDIPLLRRVRLGERLVPDAVRWNPGLPRAIASNNWAVSGRKTASGQALLANDPHLEGNRLPAVWYEIVLELGERFCIAATFPGLPVASIGRTNDLAWGATYSFMDGIDSWIEDCRDGCHRRETSGEEAWIPFRVRTEVIRRKRKPAVTLTFHENDHGVLDGDPREAGLYLATRWASAAGSGARSLASLFELLRARDVRSGMELLGRVETAWNFVLADRDGNIGYQMSGCMPRRARERDGLVPLPGWDPANDWQGFVAPDELPRALNPDRGFLATANDDLNALGLAQPINLPMGSYRADRIAECLAARDDWDVAACGRLQMDVVSLQAIRFLEVLRPLLPETPAGALLRDWDCTYAPSSRGAPLFERFYQELVVDVFGRVCGSEVLHFLTRETGILIDFYASFDRVLLDAGSVWYEEEGRDASFRRIASHALEGPPQTWGEVQRLPLRHLLFGGRLPSWLGFDRGPFPLRGSRATIHQGQIYRSGGRATSFVPSLRWVTDLGEPAAHTSLAGGPSDRWPSRGYAFDLARWLAGDLKTLRPGPPPPRSS